MLGDKLNYDNEPIMNIIECQALMMNELREDKHTQRNYVISVVNIHLHTHTHNVQLYSCTCIAIMVILSLVQSIVHYPVTRPLQSLYYNY